MMNENQANNPSLTIRNNEIQVRWKPPHWSRIKVNVDASINSSGEGRVGCVIRNYSGRCLAAKVKIITGVESVEVLEALAIYEGLSFAKEMSCNKVEVEGDCKKVEANKVAHTLAKSFVNFSDVMSDSIVWLEDFPSIICNVLLSDCS
ncbi:Ribonuclease H-like domain containing protein [Senna tora]|uniref:Ribonuclease H-like domain containing protein n=1 Tax=Senna tora TaxID=362788 RepID=A0A834TRD3_9FABA|nr:Ribonuclease H-like domain containing protein [Senna tora]